MAVFALLVGLLLPGAFGDPMTFQHVSGSLEPAPPALRTHFSYRTATTPWARHNDTIVVRERTALEVISVSQLRVERSIRLPGSVDCGLGFDGDAVVIVTGCRTAVRTRGSILAVDPLRGTVSRARVTLAPLRSSFSFAFGDGRAYLARPGEIDAIDERTGAVVVHRTRRALAKGGAFIDARWLGAHRLAVNGVIRDVRTWRLWAVLPGATHVVAGPADIVAWSANSVEVYDARARFRYRVLRGEQIGSAVILGRTLIAQVGAAYDVVDLAAGRRVAVLPQYFSELLAP